jgi:hypothetical protein
MKSNMLLRDGRKSSVVLEEEEVEPALSTNVNTTD